jgi:hypothetical protein
VEGLGEKPSSSASFFFSLLICDIKNLANFPKKQESKKNLPNFGRKIYKFCWKNSALYLYAPSFIGHFLLVLPSACFAATTTLSL